MNLMKSSVLGKIEQLAKSLIGKGSVVSKQEGNFKPKRLFVGDDANIEL
jgi:hypothetical protein